MTCFVSWPSAPLTDSLVRKALSQISEPLHFIESLSKYNVEKDGKLLQWATYDDIDHELARAGAEFVLASSYTIRKALIRKHFLHRTLQAYTTKHTDSILLRCTPKTWDLEISYADELDNMWADELWDLGQAMEEDPERWWILKPGMADRGMGIRLFKSKDDLQNIFESFEGESDDENDVDETADDDTGIVTSQLRHFVIQEYLTDCALLDPLKIPVRSGGSSPSDTDALRGHKFHLRTYCVASGDLTVYNYANILALFSSLPYSMPQGDQADELDLRPHLTNTCLQPEHGEENVRLLDELIGSTILSSNEGILTEKDVSDVKDQIGQVLAETFRAAVQMPVHFQPTPSAFELFGVDFLILHNKRRGADLSKPKFVVSLLEINAEPAIEMTGPRLTWILEDLFCGISKICIYPFLRAQGPEEGNDNWPLGEERFGLRKCLELGRK